jgi:hypothetical protein
MSYKDINKIFVDLNMLIVNLNHPLSNRLSEIVNRLDNFIKNYRNNNIIIKKQQDPLIIEKVEIVENIVLTPHYIYLEGSVVPIQNKFTTKTCNPIIFELSKSINYLTYKIGISNKVINSQIHLSTIPINSKIYSSTNTINSIKHQSTKVKNSITPQFINGINSITHQSINSINSINNISDKVINSINNPSDIPNTYKYKVYQYYIESNIIKRLQELRQYNYSYTKLSNILNDEGYVGYKGRKITRDIIRNLLKYI